MPKRKKIGVSLFLLDVLDRMVEITLLTFLSPWT